MKTLQAKRTEVDTKALWGKAPARLIDVSTVIDEPAVIFEGAEARVIYFKPESPDALGDMERALHTINYDQDFRTSGLETNSRTIGFQPRVTIRRDYCSAAACARNFPTQHAALMRGAALGSVFLEEHAPEQFHRQRALVQEKVRPEWTIPSSIFTSGICNKNNALFYHFDSGNFAKSWSCMFVFTSEVKGGELVIPQLDVAVRFQSGTAILFDGQSYLHGVTAIEKSSKRSYRYSVVYYALQQMCNCLPVADELQRIRTVKTQREKKRMKGVTP